MALSLGLDPSSQRSDGRCKNLCNLVPSAYGIYNTTVVVFGALKLAKCLSGGREVVERSLGTGSSSSPIATLLVVHATTA